MGAFSKHRGPAPLLMRDITTNLPLHCGDQKCEGTCWSYRLALQHTQHGQKLRRLYHRYKARCRFLTRHASKINPTHLVTDKHECFAWATWRFGTKTYQGMTLLDTGSMATCCNLEVARKLGIRPEDLVKPAAPLQGASGTGLHVRGVAYISLEVAGHGRIHPVYVVEEDLLIAGSDYLELMRTIINYNNKTVTTMANPQLIKEIHEANSGNVVPVSYELRLNADSIDKENVMFQVQGNKKEIERMNHREIVVYRCDPDCSEDLMEPNITTCGCATTPITCKYVVNGLVKVKANEVVPKLKEFDRIKGYLHLPLDQDDPSPTDPDSDYGSGESESEATDRPENDPDDQSSEDSGAESDYEGPDPDWVADRNQPGFPCSPLVNTEAQETSKVKLVRAEPGFVQRNLDGSYTVENPGISSCLDIEFTAGEKMTIDDALKSVICVQCRAKDTRYHLCDLDNKLCLARLNIEITIKGEDAVNWASVVTSDRPAGGGRCDGRVYMVSAANLADRQSPTVINKNIKLDDAANCYYIAIQGEISDNLVNLIRVINHAKQSGLDTVNIFDTKKLGITAKQFDKVFTDLNLCLVQKSTKLIKKVHRCKVLFPTADVLRQVLHIDKKEDKDKEPEQKTKPRMSDSELLAQLSYNGPPEFREKMQEIILEMHRHVGPHLTSMWSHGSLDIGSFHSDMAPYENFVASFPFKQDIKWRPVKVRPVPDAMLPAAREMLDDMEKAGVVKQSFSPFINPCRFLQKPNIEISKAEWIKLGNKESEFIAGMSGVQTGGLRFVTDTLPSSEACEPLQHPQLDVAQQLRKITNSTKYISVIDISSAFYHIKICDRSSRSLAFNPGIPERGIYVYRRLVMGHQCSVALLVASLMKTLGGCEDIVQYSDNLLLLSETAGEAVELARWCLARLRAFGWKCRLSKCSFVWNGRINIFGHLIDLQEGKMMPNQRKLSALAATPGIYNRKGLLKYLGSYQFWQQVLPIMSDDIAIMRTALKGDFFWGKEHQQAFENTQKILCDPKSLFVHLPSNALPIFGRVDSSEYCSAGMLFQQQPVVEEGKSRILGPYPISFYNKSWGSIPKFRHYPPHIRELYGLNHFTRQFLSDFPHHPQKRVIVTDSLVIGLLCAGARYNASLSNDKLFFSQCENLEVCWSSNLDLGLKWADYNTRSQADLDKDLKEKKKLLEELDLDEVKRVMRKYKLFEGSRPISQIIYDISYLFSLQPEETDKVDDNSVEVDADRGVATATVKGIAVQLSPEHPPPRADEPPVYRARGQVHNGVLRVHQVQTGEEEEPPPVTAAQVRWTRSKPSGPSDRQTRLSKQRTEQLAAAEKRVEHNNQTQECIQPSPNIPDRGAGGGGGGASPAWSRSRDTAEHRATLMSKLGADNYPSLGDDILSLLCPKLIDHTETPHQKYIFQRPKTAFQHYINYFLYNSNLLDVERFVKLTNKDPFYRPIIEHCQKYKVYATEDKKYFLYKGLLIVERKGEDYKNKYRVVLPCFMAGDYIAMVHLACGHPSEKKLAEMVSQRFEVQQCKMWCECTYRTCMPCQKARPAPHGQITQPRPKWTQTIRNPGCAYYADEVTIYTGATGESDLKLLVFTDVYSMYTIPVILDRQLDSEYFLELLQTHVVRPFGLCWYLCTDGAPNLSSKEVRARCCNLNINHVTLVARRPTSNLAELSNNLLLSSLRLLTHTRAIPREYLRTVITMAANIVNTSPFLNQPELTPFRLFHPTKSPSFPATGQTLENFVHTDKMSENLKNQISLTNHLYGLRNKMLEARHYPEQGKVHKNVTDKMVAGSVVLVRDFRHKTRRGLAHKLLQRYKGSYTVRARSGSSLWISPTIPIISPNKQYVQPVIRVHVSNCKLSNHPMSHPIDNTHTGYLKKFFNQHILPPLTVIDYREELEDDDDDEHYQSGYFITNWQEIADEEEEEKALEDDIPNEIQTRLLKWAEQEERHNIRMIEKQRENPRSNKVQWNHTVGRIYCRKIGQDSHCNKVKFTETASKFNIRCPEYNCGLGHREQQITLNDNSSYLCRCFTNQLGISTRCTCSKCKIGSQSCYYTDCDECTHPANKKINSPVDSFSR